MKILICDDSENTVKEIHQLLDRFTEKHKNNFDIQEYTNGNRLINSNDFFDLAFIDIEMPQINGLALTKHLKENNPNLIVFIVTSFNGYLDDAMDLNVFRYLSKPINGERFDKSLEAALKLYIQNNENLVLETSDGFHTINSQDILYIAIDKRKTRVVTDKGEYITTQSLNDWKKAVEKLSCFVQPHYSFIVNLKNVTDFTRTEITLSCKDKNEVVPISRGYYNDFRKAFFDYMGVTV